MTDFEGRYSSNRLWVE